MFTNKFYVTSRTTFGSQVYGSYQHAQIMSLSKAQSKSYTISSSGLGDVIKFNGIIGNSYDGMDGVYSELRYYDVN